MTMNDPKGTSSGTSTRKQRRAAERAARKSGQSKTKSTVSTGGSGPSMLLVSIAAIGIGLVAVVALILISGGLGGDEAAAVSESEIPAPAEELRQGRTLVQAGTTPLVSIDVYEDPQCTHCATFTKRTEPLIISKYVSDGTASLTYNDFIVFDEASWEAAVAMRVAEAMDGKFWDYHGLVFHNQAGGFSRERLADMAVLVGLDRAEFLRQMDDPSYREAAQAEKTQGDELGIGSTPTLIINGELVLNQPWEDLAAVIDEAARAAVPEA